jgi:ADP-heptose:LPS heptosyltransferase
VTENLISPSKSLPILVVRCDRLGDVILSTPVFEVIKRHYPHAHLVAMVREAVAPAIDGMKSVDSLFIYRPESRHKGLGGFFRLVSDIKAGQFRIAVVLQSQWKIAAAIFFANIRYRVGPLSKIHSFFFYNRGVRQSRSQVEMHEADYNLQLLRRLGIRVGTRNIPVSMHISKERLAEARVWLARNGWNPENSLIAVHPGMGGSALNWPEAHYIEFIRALLKEGKQVVVTGGPGESALLARIREALGTYKAKAIWYDSKTTSGTIQDLAGIFNWADLVVAPSTGPLHLAVALGKSVVTFYPPVRVQSAVRWGPYLKDETRAGILIPEVYCGEEFKCRGSLCNYHPCMKSLTVAQALEEAAVQLARAQQEKNRNGSTE